MFRAILSDEIEEVRKLLNAGEDPSSCLDDEGKPVDTLRVCLSCYNPHGKRADIAKLLLIKGAHLTSEENKQKFQESVCFIVDHCESGLYTFDSYMPLLRVFAQHNLFSLSQIQTIACYADEIKDYTKRERVERELSDLLPSSEKSKEKSRAEVAKNARLLYEIYKAEEKNATEDRLPKDILIEIAALTANPLHEEKQAVSISISYFCRPIPRQRFLELKNMIKGHINDYLEWTGFNLFKNNVAIAEETLKAITDAKDANTLKLILTQSKNKLNGNSNQSGYLRAVNRALYELEYFIDHPKLLDEFQRRRFQEESQMYRSPFLQFN